MKYPRWQEELGIPIRWPRAPKTELTEILQSTMEPQIFLRQQDDGDSIVIKFPRLSHDELIIRLGKSLPAAFQEILWRKTESHNSTWSEFEKIGHAAYRDAWLMLFDRLNRKRLDPRAENWFENLKREFDAAKPKSRSGRRPLPHAETVWLGKEFDQIFPKCELLHRAAQSAVQSLNKPAEIRKAIWAAVCKSIQYMPLHGAVFSGEAFEKMIHGWPNADISKRTRPQLHEPKNWKARQLTIALLAIRLGCEYQTLEKRIAQIRPSRRK